MQIRFGFVVSKSLLLLLAASSLSLLWGHIQNWALFPDFSVFWTAARDPKIAYDVTALTQAQSWIVDPAHGPRPFAYPPTALLIFLPFGLLPFWIAFWAWNALSIGAFWVTARRVGSGLGLLSPHVFLVLVLGQTTLLIGTAVIWAVTLLGRREYVAGALLGAVAAVKPQIILLVPIGLIAGGHWKAVAGCGVGFLAMLLAATPFGLWDEWLTVVGEFSGMARHYRLEEIGATPLMMATSLDLPALPFQIAGILAGVVIVGLAFRTKDVQTRLVCLVCGSLLASPYAMRYDLAVLAPVLVAGLLTGSRRGIIGCAPLFALGSIAAVPALLVASIARLAAPPRDSRTPDSSCRYPG